MTSASNSALSPSTNDERQVEMSIPTTVSLRMRIAQAIPQAPGVVLEMISTILCREVERTGQTALQASYCPQFSFPTLVDSA